MQVKNRKETYFLIPSSFIAFIVSGALQAVFYHLGLSFILY